MDGSQVEALGPAFTGFVNQLLEAERQLLGLTGDALHITSKEETPDAGVDAVLVSTHATEWVPVGQSSWQFKRSDLTPKKCTEELGKASFARDLVKQGGSYVLAVGNRLSSKQKKNRQEALVSATVDLELIADKEEARTRVKVYDGNALARWGSKYPAVLTYPALRANLGPVVSFERWSASRSHQAAWTPDDRRKELIDKLRNILKRAESGPLSVRIEGVSGTGKTRFALETLRDENLSSLVVYARQAQDLTGGSTTNYLLDRERQAIVVVDECDARTHEKLEEALPHDSILRLITIGESGDRPLRSPTYEPGPMDPGTVEELLKRNFSALSQQAIRFVSERCEGNVRLAIVLAERLMTQTAADAAELIRRGDVEGILRIAVPEGAPFLIASTLALFRRVGWDEEKEGQLENIAHFLDSSTSEVKKQALSLEYAGLLERQGRYRLIAPNALAVLLASEAWRIRSEEIVTRMFPTLDQEMLEELLGRAAELGRYEPSRSALETLLHPEGPFGTLDQIEKRQLGRFLINLAIISPTLTVNHLTRIIGEVPVQSLVKYTQSRRDTVWTLEKLAWHSSTFEQAADLLLKLALAENETFANNATGTWTALFRAALPSTAAPPPVRLGYLRARLRDDNLDVRRLVLSAVTTGLEFLETAMVSAEVQAGVVVEPRGGVKTRQERQDYHAELIRILRQLTNDPGDTLRLMAVDELISHAPHHLGGGLSDLYMSALRDLPEEFRPRLRRAIQQWRYDHERRRDEALLDAIDAVDAAVASEDPLETLQALASTPGWGVEEAKLVAELVPLLRTLRDEGRSGEVFAWVSQETIAAGWFLGLAIAEAWHELDIEEQLTRCMEKNSALVAGFLTRAVRTGNEHAFAEFDSRYGNNLSPIQRVDLAVRGPHIAASHERVLEIMTGPDHIEAAQALYLLTPWIREVWPRDVAKIIRSWMDSLLDQSTYDTLVDLGQFYLFQQEEKAKDLEDEIWLLLEGRRTWREMGQSRWDWGRLAEFVLRSEPLRLAKIILDLISGGIIVLQDDQEAVLFQQCARHAPDDVLSELGVRLQEGDWRIVMGLRGWGAEGFPVETVATWIDDSSEKAVLVASIAKAGDEQPTPLARWLLENFGDSDEVGSELAAEFMSGTWVGNWSSRIESQIRQLGTWRTLDSQPVQRWAEKMIEGLKADLERTLRSEAEERW